MKIATIGTGWIVDDFLKTLRSIKNADCIASYSRSEEKAKSLAQNYGVDNYYADLDAMLSNPDINFVYVASPNNLHFEHVKKALQCGKHVICEKPFTSNLREAEALVSLTHKNNLMLFEAITTIHLPNFLWIKDNISRLGSLRLIQCNFSQYSSRYTKLLGGELPNVFNLEFSGGALMDINIYNIHFALRLFGMPTNVKYYANKHKNGIDTSGIVILEYPDFLVECMGSKDTSGMNFISIQGENGYMHVENGVNGFNQVICSLPDENLVIDLQSNNNLLYYELDKFYEIFKQKDFDRCNELLDHSLSVMEVLDDARKTAGIKFPADSHNGTI